MCIDGAKVRSKVGGWTCLHTDYCTQQTFRSKRLRQDVVLSVYRSVAKYPRDFPKVSQLSRLREAFHRLDVAPNRKGSSTARVHIPGPGDPRSLGSEAPRSRGSLGIGVPWALGQGVVHRKGASGRWLSNHDLIVIPHLKLQENGHWAETACIMHMDDVVRYNRWLGTPIDLT